MSPNDFMDFGLIIGYQRPIQCFHYFFITISSRWVMNPARWNCFLISKHQHQCKFQKKIMITTITTIHIEQTDYMCALRMRPLLTTLLHSFPRSILPRDIGYPGR